MNPSIRRFTLDTNATRSQISIPVTLNDTSRVWHITLTEGGICYAIENGCLAMLTIKRPNGSYLEEFCPIAKNVTVVYDFRQNEKTAAVEGIHDCEVTIFGTNHERLTSATFTMVVGQRAVNSDDITITDDDRTAIDYIVGEEAKRQLAETERAEAFNSAMVGYGEAFSEKFNEIVEEAKNIKSLTDELESNIQGDKYIGDSVFIRYSAYSDGANFTEEWRYGQDYIGIAVAKVAPRDASGYTWRLFLTSENVRALVAQYAPEVVEEATANHLPDAVVEATERHAPDVINNLAQGIVTGIADDLKTYVRYSSNSNGADFTSKWSYGQDYIGIAVATEAPTNKEGYNWTLFLNSDTVQEAVSGSLDRAINTVVPNSVNEVMKGKVISDFLEVDTLYEPYDWDVVGEARINPNPPIPPDELIGFYSYTKEGRYEGDQLDGYNEEDGMWVKITQDYISFSWRRRYRYGSFDTNDYDAYVYQIEYRYYFASGVWKTAEYDSAKAGVLHTDDYIDFTDSDFVESTGVGVWACNSSRASTFSHEYFKSIFQGDAIKSTANGGMEDNHEYRMVGKNEIYLHFKPESLGINDIFHIGIVIKTGNVNPTISWDDGTLFFVGDDCSGGVFYPLANRIYDIVVWWNGFIYRASVSAATVGGK